MKKPIIFSPEEKVFLLSKTDSKLLSRQEKAAPRSKIDDLAEEIMDKLTSEWDHQYRVDCSSFIDRLVREFLINYGVRVMSHTYKATEVFIDADVERKLDPELVDTCVSILEKIKDQKHKIKPLNLFDASAPLEIVSTAEDKFDFEPIVDPEVKVIISENNIVIPEVKVVITTNNKLAEEEEQVVTHHFHPIIQSETLLFDFA